ncbi:hypothetical protein C5167_006510 [Papaver somniferum]|uniref:Uncharacterized protein n=1 Tax=Papaver somniferum TaxID=3469 RepID=A0A4Y7JEG3_PAPSO|nr:hypothetical protein C5167_006510 [Papaver somniferum]
MYPTTSIEMEIRRDLPVYLAKGVLHALCLQALCQYPIPHCWTSQFIIFFAEISQMNHPIFQNRFSQKYQLDWDSDESDF